MGGGQLNKVTHMKLKASSDYGIRAVFYLAMNDRVCSSKEISEEMAIPRDYLIQLALRLRDAGILKARPGKNGGYELAKKPEKISVFDVIDALDAEDKQSRHPLSKKKSNASVVDVVRYSQKVMMKSYAVLFSKITVGDLVAFCSEGRDPKDMISCAFSKITEG